MQSLLMLQLLLRPAATMLSGEEQKQICVKHVQHILMEKIGTLEEYWSQR
jgi:hypothetical protein